ncbi:hypothetical protein ACOMHN_061672 [Nucella lapillus]
MIKMMCFKMKFSIASVCVLIILSQVGKVQGGAGSEWGYDGDLGPSKWYTNYSHCGGRMQSPINVETNQVLYDPLLQTFDLNQYAVCKNCTMTLENVGGHTVEVGYGGPPIIIKGGNLPDSYVLGQFHFHWGATNTLGSEHTFDNKHAPLEMHAVHYMTKYSNISDAASQPYGLAVIAFFFQIGEENPDFKEFLANFKNVVHKDSKKELEPFPVWNLVWSVGDSPYYRYMGSLTTPPCYESIIWTLIKNRITISQEQLNQFRTLRNDKEGAEGETPISGDFRPVQPLDYRRVMSNDRLLLKDMASYIIEDLRQDLRTLRDSCVSGAGAVRVSTSLLGGLLAALVWFWKMV